MYLEIRIINEDFKKDINIPNQPFKIRGRLLVSFVNNKWKYKEEVFKENQVKEMTFPNENYNFEKMNDYVFI